LISIIRPVKTIRQLKNNNIRPTFVSRMLRRSTPEVGKYGLFRILP
jgi:hypothetical protein